MDRIGGLFGQLVAIVAVKTASGSRYWSQKRLAMTRLYLVQIESQRNSQVIYLSRVRRDC